MTKLGLIVLLSALAPASNPTQASSLDGPGWRPVTLSSGAPTAKQQIVFDANGRVYGSDGCNRFSGRYTVDASGKLTIDTSSMMATKMGCRDIGDQTSTKALMQALTDTHSFRLDDGKLTLLDSAGNEMAQLAR